MGVLRTGNVGISGTSYKPLVPDKEGVIKELNSIINDNVSVTEKSIKLMLYLMRAQIFWGGNKRTSMIIANKIMIENGTGIITVKEENINEFNKLLTQFYDTNEIDNILSFIYNNCIFGLEVYE